MVRDTKTISVYEEDRKNLEIAKKKFNIDLIEEIRRLG